ncbi:3-deoxy-manno-octulosonate cytidylyltransferase [Algisphaera agarilytica]|uniref:3-deoxy-manno-octulosonate cytidylyltransferase n=1 Tax=Algisphaera agarilytica TaxID=1385975 RepID=A0A7X0LJN3_9BACT|nr:3-deoxy-manno-octulosonate cytidylyltransferase [Algisphaera agarilytica]MBB6428939.1 3-deoxy-manno-octulosonate cytidylyltransferase (CMP-KDO synthetase) [Algisphaera agarilytica]
MPKALALIPARIGSTRFPGKPLAAETGKPLIQHVVEQVGGCETIDRVVVATDDQGIFDAVVGFGGEAVMTSPEHPNGTSRLAEAAEKLGTDHELIVNVQGDEPEVPPATVDALVRGLAEDQDADMATLASPFGDDEDPTNPNVVKLVLDRLGRAMYFSRSPIPHDRDAEMLGTKPHVTMYKHPGLYAYRRAFLAKYPTLEPTPLEEAEKLEQLRVLEHGFSITIIHADAPHPGIDTPEQYAAFVERFRQTQNS